MKDLAGNDTGIALAGKAPARAATRPGPPRTGGARTLHLLVTSAGRRVELIGCFRSAAAELGIRLVVHAADMRPDLSAACHVADRAHRVPPCGDGYPEALRQLCQANAIDLLVPTIDPELLPLARSREAFAKAGTRVAVGDVSAVAIARDKLRTMEHLRAAGVPVPRTASLNDARFQPWRFPGPLIVKPVAGSAGHGVRRIDKAADLPGAGAIPTMVQERLEGPEYTLNAFVDESGQLRAAIPHRRLSVRAGEVEKGVTVRDPRLAALARAVHAALPGLYGASCFQLIDDPIRGPRVFEINARFGGGYPLADRAGGRFARWLLEETICAASTAGDGWTDGVTMLRYDAAVFADG